MTLFFYCFIENSWKIIGFWKILGIFYRKFAQNYQIFGKFPKIFSFLQFFLEKFDFWWCLWQPLFPLPSPKLPLSRIPKTSSALSYAPTNLGLDPFLYVQQGRCAFVSAATYDLRFGKFLENSYIRIRITYKLPPRLPLT